MEWDIARDGIVLHSADGSGPARLGYAPLGTARRRVREHPIELPASVEEWLDHAREDLRNIEIVLESSSGAIPWSTMCFHGQQAAEKSLKAALVSRWLRPPRTHNLVELAKALKAAGCDLGDLAAELEALTTYAVDARYPKRTVIPNESEGRPVVQGALRIVEAARTFMRRT
ncbi:MAG: HEPN domain-containing protein [Gemmatimonadaceae bacterium]